MVLTAKESLLRQCIGSWSFDVQKAESHISQTAIKVLTEPMAFCCARILDV